jgi:hypothetical protein
VKKAAREVAGTAIDNFLLPGLKLDSALMLSPCSMLGK